MHTLFCERELSFGKLRKHPVYPVKATKRTKKNDFSFDFDRPDKVEPASVNFEITKKFEFVNKAQLLKTRLFNI